MPELGEYITETLQVTPFDDDTAAALTVTAPDGSVSTPIVTGSEDGHTWTAVVHLTQIKVWQLSWAITGTGAGVKTRSVLVDAPWALAAWAPGHETIADYVPGRTLVTDSETHLLTFDDTTRPTGDEVDRLTAAAVAWVVTPAGTIHPSLYEMASSTAAVRVAGFVELGYPDRAADEKVGETLLAQADKMRADLVRANTAATGTNPSDPGAALIPLFSFPAAPTWADTNF